jgi:hypothetical protein
VGQLVEREKRLELHLSVRVRGEDVAGVPFSEASRTLNISGGGICFECHRNLTVGARVALAIELPPPLRPRFGDRPVYRARAVVCRVERFEGQPVARIGARFLGE